MGRKPRQFVILSGAARVACDSGRGVEWISPLPAALTGVSRHSHRSWISCAENFLQGRCWVRANMGPFDTVSASLREALTSLRMTSEFWIQPK